MLPIGVAEGLVICWLGGDDCRCPAVRPGALAMVYGASLLLSASVSAAAGAVLLGVDLLRGRGPPYRRFAVRRYSRRARGAGCPPVPAVHLWRAGAATLPP